MGHCLSKSELADFINESAGNSTEYTSWYSHANSWGDETIGMNYFVVQIVLAHIKDGHSGDDLISRYFALNEHESIWFTQEELSHDFVEYMMMNTRDRSVSLEEELIDLRERMGNYKYDQTIRY